MGINITIKKLKKKRNPSCCSVLADAIIPALGSMYRRFCSLSYKASHPGTAPVLYLTGGPITQQCSCQLFPAKYLPTFDSLHNVTVLICWHRARVTSQNGSDTLSSAGVKPNYKANRTKERSDRQNPFTVRSF